MVQPTIRAQRHWLWRRSHGHQRATSQDYHGIGAWTEASPPPQELSDGEDAIADPSLVPLDRHDVDSPGGLREALEYDFETLIAGACHGNTLRPMAPASVSTSMSHRRRSLHARRELDNLRDMSNASQATSVSYTTALSSLDDSSTVINSELDDDVATVTASAKQTQLADIGATARATGTRFKNSPEVENGTGALETAAMNHGPNLRTRIAILFDMIIASVYDVPLRGFHAAQQFVAILAGIFFALVARNQEEDSVADKA